MKYMIVNNAGGLIHRTGEVKKGERSRDWPDEESARDRCAEANADAMELGLEARYEVVEVQDA